MKRNVFAIFLTLTLVVALAFVVAPTAQAAESTMVLEANTDNLIINEDTLLDLAGFNATVTVANGKTLSVIDSGNIGKEGTAAGTLTVAEGNEGTVAVEAEDAAGKRYLKVATGENTYSFHPFYLTIKQIGVNTNKTALCLQAMFVTTEAAQDAIETGVIYGETEMTSAAPTFGAFAFEDGVMYAYYDLMGSLADADGNEPEGFETEKSFQAYITVGGKTVYSKTTATFSPKQVIESLNTKAENAEAFVDGQREKMVNMITGKAHLEALCGNFLGNDVVIPDPQKYVFSEYSAGVNGTDNEEHVMDENVTVYTTNCNFNTQIRMYATADNRGEVVIVSKHAISQLVLNAGKQSNTLVISVSNDEGKTWTELHSQAIVVTPADYTFDLGTGYKYIKISLSEISNQVRLYNMTLTFTK